MPSTGSEIQLPPRTDVGQVRRDDAVDGQEVAQALVPALGQDHELPAEDDEAQQDQRERDDRGPPGRVRVAERDHRRPPRPSGPGLLRRLGLGRRRRPWSGPAWARRSASRAAACSSSALFTPLLEIHHIVDGASASAVGSTSRPLRSDHAVVVARRAGTGSRYFPSDLLNATTRWLVASKAYSAPMPLGSGCRWPGSATRASCSRWSGGAGCPRGAAASSSSPGSRARPRRSRRRRCRRRS